MARGHDETKTRRRSRKRRVLPIGRMVSLLAFLPVASRAPMYAQLIFALLTDGRMPNSRKALLAGAVGYLALGKDLVADEIPLLGGLDDLVVVVLAVDLFLDGVPADLLDEKLVALGIDRAAFDSDIAQIRRLTPGPVRRAVRRLPGMVAAAGNALQETGVAPRVRAWISKEDSIA
ncbi:MAG TPA: DUF1232 domain-containing protein [Clostridia bacterium]|nr:DUF1232 domain-containing protein [Clostridia bacterium]